MPRPHLSDSDLISLGWYSGVSIFTKFSSEYNVQQIWQQTGVVEDLSMETINYNGSKWYEEKV